MQVIVITLWGISFFGGHFSLKLYLYAIIHFNSSGQYVLVVKERATIYYRYHGILEGANT